MNKASFILAMLLSSGTLSVAAGETYTPGQQIDQDFQSFVRPFLSSYCVDCHGETAPEGDLALPDLGPVDEVNSGIW
jgi:hypothetical protein